MERLGVNESSGVHNGYGGKKRLMRVRKPNKKKERSPYTELVRYIKGLEKRYHDYFDRGLRYWS